MAKLTTVLWFLAAISLSLIAVSLMLLHRGESMQNNTVLDTPKLASYVLHEDELRIIAVGDLHGDFTALEKILAFAGMTPSTLLVQTGDLLDRGDDTIPLLDFFLQSHSFPLLALLGNHEAMNLAGTWRYVSPGDVRSFGSEGRRKEAFGKGQPYGELLRRMSERYADVTETVGDVLFVHGGISLSIAADYKSVSEINAAYHSLSTISISGILGTDGPLWFREYARSAHPTTCTEIRKVLDILGATYMVMGHTVKDKIEMQCDRAVFIDTGISYAMMGHLSALEIVQRNGVTVRMRALYETHAETLFDWTELQGSLGTVVVD